MIFHLRPRQREFVQPTMQRLQFIEMIAKVEPIKGFDIDLYFAPTEKVVVHDEGRLIVGLLDGTEVDCEFG